MRPTSKMFFLFFFISLVPLIYCIHNLPKELTPCKRFDPNLNNCLLKATEQIKPLLVKGIPELNLPPIEPFNVTEIILQQGTSALNFKATLKNVVVYGLPNYKFSQFDFDVPNLQWFCRAKIPNMTLAGEYFVNGKILVAPIEGSGRFTAGICTNSDIYVHQICKVVQKKGVSFLQPTLTNTTIKVGGPVAKLQGLFGGNEALNKVTNQVINDNVNELFEDLKPVIENIISDILEKWLFKTIEDNIPFDKLYPKD